MDQDRINQAEWENPDNWSGPRWLGVYCSRTDTRVVVPKRIPVMGWTVNLGRKAGVVVLLGTLVGIALLVVLGTNLGSPAR